MPPLKIWRHWQLDQFEQAIADLDSWLDDCDRHGIGTAALAFDSQNPSWLVLISPDIERATMPF
jgi:hypothetical protein